MFSQLRHAVETFAPQPRRSVDEHADPNNPDTHSRSQSVDSHGHSNPTSPAHLADAALANLRKSFVSQRPASPSSPAKSPSSATSPPASARPYKSRLEDRLRASFAIGEASNGSTPDTSARASPAPATTSEVPDNAAVNIHPLSPTSTPLPESPILSPTEPESLSLVFPMPGYATSSVKETFISSNAAHESPSFPASEETDPQEKPTPTTPNPESLNSEATEPATLPSDHIPEETAIPLVEEASDVDTLQKRLKLVEQRFADVSTSFKRLQAEKLAADAVLRELTPLETMKDIDSLRDYLQNVKLKAEITQEEINRLNGKLQTQEGRIEELRDTHRLESKSQSEQIDRLRRQLEELEALLAASQGTISLGEEEIAKQKLEIERLQADMDKSKTIAKEEEEKRVKAISLLKTVRQKLVKAEKDKEEVAKESSLIKDRERDEREKAQVEKARLMKELESSNEEREKAVKGLRAQFDKEVASLKERYERDIATMRGQFELEAVTAKGTYAKDIAAKNAQISQLEQSRDALSRDKNTFFDQLQMRQAELESSQSHLESLQSQNTELEYQLRESLDRIALLTEELTDVRREQDLRSREPSGSSSEEVSRLISSLETKYESKLTDLRRSLSIAEKERNDSEADWSRKLREKVRELEDLRQVLGSVAQTRRQDESIVDDLKAEVERWRSEAELTRSQLSELHNQLERLVTAESLAKEHENETNAKITWLEGQLEEVKARESQLRINNKTLREELRKVQSSAALLERQRNPGVGYWTKKESSATSDSRTSISSMSSESLPRINSPPPSGTSSVANQEEDVNLEYLRNVILQFLEHKEMRPNLVRVLSIILRFTPQETRRLVAKV